uniref:JmjC domain-containing protein n=1 Tax=Zea mays TaxID=4577 RepID=A0A804QMT6_MAIZE
MACRAKVVGQVERVDGESLSYAEFVRRFMAPNRPVVLTGLTSSWRAHKDWTLSGSGDLRRPNLGFFTQNFPSSLVQVDDCSSSDFTDQKRLEMSMQEFIDHWVGGPHCGSSDGDRDGSLLYLKDWHFVKEYPDYIAYTTPTFFVDDWLNMYLDSHPIHRDSDIANHKNEINCSDYRFVYMGAKGTWTPLHADVFRSYSWSANVCGQKQWLFLPPSQSHCIFDRNMRSSVYNLHDVSEKQFPEFKWLECIQEQNEIIFVPSGWYHQVHNLEDTISINHNWCNAYNLHWVWNLLYEDYKVAKEYIEDIRDICDDFEGLCQRNLAANTGMNFYDFFVFIVRFALANVVELYHLQQPEVATLSTETAHHLVYNLMSIRNVASKMTTTEAFTTENRLCSVSEDNRSAFSNIKQILEEESFRRLSMTLSKAYDHIDRGQRSLKSSISYRKGCSSVICLKSDCNVVDYITSLVDEICGPEDLTRLIDSALSHG